MLSSHHKRLPRSLIITSVLMGGKTELRSLEQSCLMSMVLVHSMHMA